MLRTKYAIFLSALVILIISAMTGMLYDWLPDRIASHWNAAGEVDDTMPRWGIFLLPAMSIIMMLLFRFLPNIDPLKKNIAQFRPYYDGLMLLIVIFLAYIHLLILSWNVGVTYPMEKSILPGIAVLFFYLGVLLKHSKRNWFVGIRTPWTLSSDTVWDKTHEIGSTLFKAIGILIIIAMFLPFEALFLVIFGAVGLSLFLVVYSYVLYRQEEKK